MDDVEHLKKALEVEIEKSSKHLNDKFGKEFMDDFYEKMDIAMEKAVKERFENLAGVSNKHVDKHKE